MRIHLRQASEDGGAAGGAAAHGGEGVVEHQAALGQRAKVGGADHRIVIHLRLKAGIISWKRENNLMSSCAACRLYPYRPAKTIKPPRAEINIYEATVQNFLLWNCGSWRSYSCKLTQPICAVPLIKITCVLVPFAGQCEKNVRKENALITSRNSD